MTSLMSTKQTSSYRRYEQLGSISVQLDFVLISDHLPVWLGLKNSTESTTPADEELQNFNDHIGSSSSVTCHQNH